MAEEQSAARSLAERIVELEAELEAAGNASTDHAELARCREVIFHWLAGMTGIVASPALGRVTLIHGDGQVSAIASPDLAYLISGPMKTAETAET